MNEKPDNDPRLYAIPDIHGHAKGEHKAYTDERPIPLSARMLFLWFYHACRRGWPRFLMVTDHMNYLTFEDPAAINLVRRALKLAQAGDLYGAAETASVEVNHAAVVSDGLRRGMRYSIGAEVDNDPRSRPDAQNIVDAMKPDGMVRSVHFLTIDHPAHGPNWNWPFDNHEFADVFDVVGTEKTWELYMATLLDAVERLPGNIVGHFYVPAIFGHWPDDETLERYEDQIVAACEARGMAIEFNTRFLYREHSDEEKARYLAAHRRLLIKCKEKNVGIAVGSDAHSPKDQGAAFATVLALLDECEINELVFPIAGRLLRVALRVERKPEVVEPPRNDERKPVRKAVRPGVAEAAETTPDPEPVAEMAVAVTEAPVKPKPKRSRAKPPAAADVESGASEATALEPLAPGEAEATEATEAAEALESPSEAPDTEAIAGEPALPDPPAPAVEAHVPISSEPVAAAEATPADVEAAAVPSAKSGAVRKPKAGPATPKSTSAQGPVKAASAAAPAAAQKLTKVAAAPKASAKKTPAAKVPAPAKKSAPKKAAPKKAVEKKTPAKKAAVRAASAKKSTAKKTAAKKAAPKKPAQRRR